MTVEQVHARSRIDPWFLRAIASCSSPSRTRSEGRRVARPLSVKTAELMLKAKQHGFLDRQLGRTCWNNVAESEVRRVRKVWV